MRKQMENWRPMGTSELSCSKKLAAMDVGTVLHMKEGQGATSYAQNSSLQKKTLEALKHMILDSAVEAYESEKPQSFAMADLGCSSGPNSLSLVGDIVEAIDMRCRDASRPRPEFMVYLNDLPSNDFNTLFASFPEAGRRLGGGGSDPLVFMAGVPGSFYGRLFPSNSLHFVSSCYSLHWLSQVPLGIFDDNGKPINKGKMYISHTSPPAVAIAYFKQFQQDFNLFLRSRSEEMLCGGRMVLTMLGRKTGDHRDKNTSLLWEVLSESFAVLVSQGALDEEKLDSYNVPFYAPNIKEIEDEVHHQGSFTIDHIEVYELSTSNGDAKDGKITSTTIRAIQESMIRHHFGEEIIDILFQNYSIMLSEVMAKEEVKGINVIVVLRKSH